LLGALGSGELVGVIEGAGDGLGESVGALLTDGAADTVGLLYDGSELGTLLGSDDPEGAGDAVGLIENVGTADGAGEGRAVSVGNDVGMGVFVGARDGDGDGLCVSVGTALSVGRGVLVGGKDGDGLGIGDSVGATSCRVRLRKLPATTACGSRRRWMMDTASLCRFLCGIINPLSSFSALMAQI